MSDDLSAIKQKIAACMKLQRAATTPGEAAAAAEAVQRLLRKHNLELAEVETATGVVAEDYVAVHARVGAWREKLPGWAGILVRGVADGNGCRVIRDSSKVAGVLQFVGKRTDIEVCTLLWVYLAREVDRLTEEGWERAEARAAVSGNRLPKARAWKNAFRVGAATEVARRLRAEREAGSQQDGTYALVRRQDAELADAVKRLVGALRSGDVVRTNDHDGYRAGREAGGRIALRKGLKGEGDAWREQLRIR